MHTCHFHYPICQTSSCIEQTMSMPFLYIIQLNFGDFSDVQLQFYIFPLCKRLKQSAGTKQKAKVFRKREFCYVSAFQHGLIRQIIKYFSAWMATKSREIWVCPLHFLFLTTCKLISLSIQILTVGDNCSCFHSTKLLAMLFLKISKYKSDWVAKCFLHQLHLTLLVNSCLQSTVLYFCIY